MKAPYVLELGELRMQMYVAPLPFPHVARLHHAAVTQGRGLESRL